MNDSKPAVPQDLRADYVREVLRLYRATPGVLGNIRRADRTFAAGLFDQGVPLYAVANALLVAAARRVLHNGFSTPMPPIRSLHYFDAVVTEMLERPFGYRDIEELQHKLHAARRR